MSFLYRLKSRAEDLPFDGEVRIYSEGEDVYFLQDGVLSRCDTREWDLVEEAEEVEEVRFSDGYALVRKRQGIAVNKKFGVLAELVSTEEFGDDFSVEDGREVRLGRFFADGGIGVLVRSEEFSFYAFKQDRPFRQYPLFPLEGNLDLLNAQERDAEVMIQELHRNGQEDVVLRTEDKISAFCFDEANVLKGLFQFNLDGPLKGQTPQFANITGGAMKDMLFFTESGLLVYSWTSGKGFDLGVRHRLGRLDRAQFVDLDADGIDEMVANSKDGLAIFEHNRYRRKFQRVLRTPPLQWRHDRVVHTADGLLFASGKNGLNVYEVEKVQLEVKKPDIQTKPESVKSELPQFRTFAEKEELLLNDTLDFSSVYNSVDQSTGKVKFSLPLVDILKSVSFNIFYDGGNTVSDYLGSGWFSTQDKIVRHHRSSVFPEDERYTLVFKGVPLELTRNETGFHLDGADYKFEGTSNRVEMEAEGMKMVYGGMEDALVFEVRWRDWNGPGGDIFQQVTFARELRLKSIANKGHVLNFDYEKVDINMPGSHSYTREIYLKQVYDGANRLRFFYADKRPEEYDLLPSRDEETRNFNMRPANTKYLTGYSLETPSYVQNVSLSYSVVDGKRFLTEISQKDQAVIKFSYEDGVIRRVTLPNSVSVDYEYETIKGVQNIKEIETGNYENYKLHYINKYIVESYYYENKTVIGINDGEMKGLQNFTVEGEKVKKLLSSEDTICAVFRSGRLQAFRKQDGLFVERESFNFTDSAVFQPGRDFLVYEDEAVGVVEYDESTGRYVKSEMFPRDDSVTKVFNRLVANYDDATIKLAYKSGGTWEIKPLKMEPGFLSGMKAALAYFDYSEEYKGQIYRMFSSVTLQMYNNLFALATFAFNSPRFETRIKFFLLNSTYDVARESDVVRSQDDISTFVKDIPLDDSILEVAYKLSNDTLKADVVGFKGALGDQFEQNVDQVFNELDNEEKRIRQIVKTTESEKTKVIMDKAKVFYRRAKDTYKHLVDEKVLKELSALKTILQTEQAGALDKLANAREVSRTTFARTRAEICRNFTQALPRDNLLLEPDRYMFYLFNGRLTNGEVQYVFTGDDVIERRVKRDEDLIKLDKTYSLAKRNDNYWIKGRGDDIDLEVSDLQNIKLGYPFYMASTTPEGVKVVEFHDNKAPDVYKIQGELVTSGYTVLVTRNGTKVSVRPQLLRYALPDLTVRKLHMSYGGRTFTTGYHFKSPKLGSRLYYEMVTIVPGDDLKYGRTELHNGTRTDFNGDGLLVKSVNVTEPAENEKVEAKAGNLFYDKSGQLIISDFTPFDYKNDEIYYYGFEDYEENRKLSLNGNEIIAGFSFTGRRYLQVKTKVEGRFSPKNQNGVYRISCWLRPGKEYAIGDKTVLLKVVAESKQEVVGVVGEVLLKRADWVYVEAVIDLEEARAIEETENGFSDTLNVRMQISHCDLDHVLFSPVESSPAIAVYDEEGQVRETVTNGLVSRKIYKKKRLVAEVDEHGDLERIESKGRDSVLFVAPAKGRYENFALSSFGKTLALEDDRWKVSPGRMDHQGEESVLHLLNGHCFSFDYGLGKDSQLNIGDLMINDGAIQLKDETRPCNEKGELIVISINSKTFVWLDGNILFEKNVSPSMDLKVKGDVYIRNLFVFEDPSVRMRYFDPLGRKTQDVQLRDEDTAIVQQFLYDELGRLDIYTQPAVLRGPVFGYHEDFVRNGDPAGEDSVWKTGKIKGEAGEFSFTRFQFDGGMNRLTALGLPGRDYSTSSPFCKHFAYNRTYPFLRKIFTGQTRFETEEKLGGVEKVKIFDSSDNWVGSYIKVRNGKGLLSTYEYKGKNVVQVLPPLYHENVGTLTKLHKGETQKERMLKKIIGVNSAYDEEGNLVETTNPDTGRTRYVYEQGLLKFIIYDDTVTFFDYEGGQLSHTGYLKSKELNSGKVVYQSFLGGEERSPAVRGKISRTVTHGLLKLVEETFKNKELLVKRLIMNGGLSLELKKKTKGNFVQVDYPVYINNEKFTVNYKYNRLGQLTDVYTENGLVNISYVYNGLGLVVKENKGFTRVFEYESPGFLRKIKDDFLTEEISYKQGSYGGLGYGDGTVVKTTFEPHWQSTSEDDNSECYEVLKRRGYFDERGHLEKDFYPDLEPEELDCRDLYEKHFPSKYGHSYAYGKYQQLVKAKFFVRETPAVLQPSSFAAVPGINANASKAIWNALRESGFIVEDREFLEDHLSHGRKGRSVVNRKVFRDLEANGYRQYKLVEKGLLSLSGEAELAEILGKKTVSFLKRKGHLKKRFDEDFIAALGNFTDKLPDLVRILRKGFATELGNSRFDMDHHEIDPNGNLKKYYNGFDSYELSYVENTNKINRVKRQGRVYRVSHDRRGNVVKAEHKGIEVIKYNTVSNLPNEVVMANGLQVGFSYDSSGRRVYKTVRKGGELVKEVFYLRDENGRTVVERQVNYEGGPVVVITTYIYGPLGLTGFVREGRFYSVLTDHEGSVRLIVRDSEVVAAYDYLPYGGLMRQHAAEAGLSYRFTGHEYDEETGLYNFHARLYDPSLGRFYQADPKGQYFSPYVYAGNSPVAFVDSDGEHAALIILIPAFVGLFAGIAAANDSWDVTEWDFTSKETWRGGLEGLMSGLKISYHLLHGTMTAFIIKKSVFKAKVLLSELVLDKMARKILEGPQDENLYSSQKKVFWLFQTFRESVVEADKELDRMAKELKKSTCIRKTKRPSDFEWGMTIPLVAIASGNEKMMDGVSISYNNILKGMGTRLGGPSGARSKKKSYRHKIKKVLRKRQKRETDEGYMVIHTSNITLIASEYDDAVLFIKEDIPKGEDLELGLQEMNDALLRNDERILSRVRTEVRNLLDLKLKDFEPKDFQGLILDDEAYEMYGEMIVAVLQEVLQDERGRTVRENLAALTKEVWDELGLKEEFERVRFVRRGSVPWEMTYEDNLVATGYKEPYGGRITAAGRDWIAGVEPGDQVYQELDGTVLLADVLLAKKGKRSLYRAKRRAALSEVDATAYTLTVVEVFEEVLEGMGAKFDLFSLSGQVRKKIVETRFDEITPLLDTLVKNSTVDFQLYQKGKEGLDQRIHQIFFNDTGNVLKNMKMKREKNKYAFQPRKAAYEKATNFGLISGKTN